MRFLFKVEKDFDKKGSQLVYLNQDKCQMLYCYEVDGN